MMRLGHFKLKALYISRNLLNARTGGHAGITAMMNHPMCSIDATTTRPMVATTLAASGC